MTTAQTKRTPGGRGNGTKLSVYLPPVVLREIRAEAQRLGRSISWVVKRAWKLAREEVTRLPPRQHGG